MASKLLHSLTDNENTDLQRQIGCMTGIFQIFDRHHVLTGGRHIHPKKLQQTTSHFNTHDPIESHKGKKISNNNAANEKQRIVNSMESSQTSFSSSSRSSSFSSIDCSRTTTTAQPETAFSFERVIFPDTPSRIASMSQSNASPQFSSHQSIDLRDVVKDSMLYREVELSEWSLNQTGSGEVHRRSCNSTSTTNIFAFPKDCPRFSYDLGENFKSTAPRLSLDSSSKESKPRLLRNSKSQREVSNCLNGLDSSLQQTSTIHKRLPSVVAKLMGLEALPANENQTMPSMKTSVVVEEPKQGSSRKEPTSPRRRNNDFVVMKPITTSRFPIEPAPWKQIDGGKRSQSQRSKTNTIRATDTFPSVYGEIEKRMKDIEFTQAGKDLRALKQILDAMQTKGLLETEIEDDRKPVMKSRQIVNSESPIVIMKPAKLVEKKSSIPTSSVIQMDRTTKDQIQKSSKTNVRTPKPPQSSSRRSSSSNNQLPPKDEEKLSNSAKTSSISPRLHQKKLELQKKSRPPTPPSDSNKSRRQSNSIQPSPSIESNSSPGGKRRAKPLAKLKKEEKSNHSSDGYIVSDSATETEVTSSFRPAEKLDFEELVPITAEQQQPSPVSVLDNSIYSDNEDDSTNGNYVRNRKKLENVELLVEKLKKLNSGHNESQTDYIASLCEDTNPDHRYISEILLASGLILRDLNYSTSEEAFRFHPSGYPINPELYLVLEQTKASKHKEEKGNEKVHRKLVFDLVNEILSVKLLSSVRPYSETWLRPAKSCLNGQKLLKELCCEIDEQHKQIEEEDDSLKSIVWEDVLDGKGAWMDFSSEISDVVLDVERMLFKDLVDEIVRGEEAVVAGRFRRQIFLH